MMLRRTATYVFVGLLCLIISLLLLFGYVFAAGHNQDNDSIVLINGEAISPREFGLFADANRAKVYSNFKRMYGVDDGPRFWITETGGEKPADKLKELTLERLIDTKIQQQWAKEEGIIADESYRDFLDRWQADTEERTAALQKKQVVYGPQRYDEMGYYVYRFSNQVEALKRHLAMTKYKPNDIQIKQYYQEQQARFAEKATVAVQILYIPNHDGKGEALLKEAERFLSNGMSFEEVVDELAAPAGQIQLGEQRIGGKTDDPKMSAWLEEVVSGLEAGQRTGFIEYGEGWAALKCLDTREGRIKPFQEVREEIILGYSNAQYASELGERRSRVSVQLNEDAYMKLVIH